MARCPACGVRLKPKHLEPAPTSPAPKRWRKRLLWGAVLLLGPIIVTPLLLRGLLAMGQNGLLDRWLGADVSAVLRLAEQLGTEAMNAGLAERLQPPEPAAEPAPLWRDARPEAQQRAHALPPVPRNRQSRYANRGRRQAQQAQLQQAQPQQAQPRQAPTRLTRDTPPSPGVDRPVPLVADAPARAALPPADAEPTPQPGMSEAQAQQALMQALGDLDVDGGSAAGKPPNVDSIVERVMQGQGGNTPDPARMQAEVEAMLKGLQRAQRGR